ncbi:alpha-L-fucosidase [Pontiella sulfatireligans]|nr:alpha-L-fucosidase [Pontiella sulfatireligans]
MKTLILNLLLLAGAFAAQGAVETGTFTDVRDGQSYKTITVGEHTWMAENLNYETSASWCWGDDPANGEMYGRLYKFRTALSVAPKGWHVATDAEWDALVDAFGGADLAGKTLKSSEGWQDAGNGTDSIGFGALPGGDRFIDGTPRQLGKDGCWWSAGEGTTPVARHRTMGFDTDYVYRLEHGEAYARSVRCVKDYPVKRPKFVGTVESLKQYECPEWFRDAKFGIYLHWGIYSVAEMEAWYGRFMYWQGTEEYRHHLKNYGHPSEFGYKDLIPLWKAEKFDPDALVSLFKEAGAKYFTPVAVHHDNFDLWDSKYHKWNAVNMGPKKDLIGMWKAAADKAGLRWGVTTHLARNYQWMSRCNDADVCGPMKGIPYDAAQGEGHGFYPPNDGQTWALNAPETMSREWRASWLKRLKQLVDDYEPDHMYFDGAIPFAGDDQGRTGMEFMAHYYNARPEGFLCFKQRKSGIVVEGVGSLDHERGKADDIHPEPWQTDDSIGAWGYRRSMPGDEYMNADVLIDKIIDIVSKNGNMLLNIPMKADGTIDQESTDLLKNCGRWFKVNGEAIYGTRPWYTYGEGENVIGKRDKTSCMTSSDIRFVTKADVLYAFVLNWPENGQPVVIEKLGSNQPQVGTIAGVELLGYTGTLNWKQTDAGLCVIFPKAKTGDYAHALKIRFK